MIQPGLAVQQAMMASLRALPSLSGLLGGAHVYDALPRGANPPYVTFTALETRDWSVADQKAHESFITLEVAAKARGRAQLQAMVQEIETALDGASLTLAGHRLVNLRLIFISSANLRARDFTQATLRFRAATEPL